MAQVITFLGFVPIERYDSIPWTQARIEEGTTVDGPWVALETISLSPVDADPANPAARNLTTELADDAFDLWYRIVFIDGTADESIPTTPIQNTDPSQSATYATVDELARILKIRTPSDEQSLALARVMASAALEINREIDLAAGVTLTSAELALAAQVNLERAAELWKLQEIQFGILELGGDFGPTRIARNTWEKHAFTLAPLKNQWGLA
jgi:hypothetical protein